MSGLAPDANDARKANPRVRSRRAARAPRSRAQVVKRWRDLREMLIHQLDSFENGGLTLHSNDADITPSAIADVKQSILEFDALISRDALDIRRSRSIR